MKKIGLLALLAALTLSPSLAGATAPTSTINPNVPAQNSALSSAVLRANFLAAYNDINTIYGQISTIVTNGITALNGDVTTGAPSSGVASASVSKIQGNTVNGTTGSGNVVFSTAPILTLPNATGLPLSTGVTGVLPIINGGTGSTNGQISGVITYPEPQTVSIGSQALASYTPVGTGQMVDIGYQAGFSSTTTAQNNVFVGWKAGYSNTSGALNDAYGHDALGCNQTGTNNTALGEGTMYGLRIISAGDCVLYSSNYNTAIGASAMLYYKGSSGYNTAVGQVALGLDTTGDANTCIGQNCLGIQTTAIDNVAIGVNAGDNITTGGSNLMVGFNTQALSATTSNQMNIDGIIYGMGVGYPSAANSGTVGIGTATVSALNKFEVNGAASIGYTNVYGGSVGGLIVAGNVGVGTTSPTNALTVIGTAQATNFSGTGASLSGTVSGASAVWSGLDQANQVSIGTATAASKLNVYGNVTIGTTYSGTAAPANGLLVQGSVGIGTTVPSQQFEIYDTTGTSPSMSIVETVANQPAWLAMNAASGGQAGVLYQRSGTTYFDGVLDGNNNWLLYDQQNGVTDIYATRSSSAQVSIGTQTVAGTLNVYGTIKTRGFTVATLPSGTVGMRAYVTDQTTSCPASGAALTGSGAITCPVFYNGSAWVGD